MPSSDNQDRREGDGAYDPPAIIGIHDYEIS
jgi:hypothetical protein